MESALFYQLSIVLGACSFLGLLVYKFKLPLVVAYLLAGVLLSAAQLADFSHTSVLSFLPNIGIAFVLFLIGMELDLRELKLLGKPIIISSLGQIIISSIASYALAGLLGFKQTESILLGIGMSFSSTVVVVKLLLEKKELSSLYGKLSLGILLLEDLVAIAVLMVMSVGSSSFHLGLQQNLPILTLVIKAILLFGLTFVLSRYVLEKLFSIVARSSELLFMSALTWCFLFTSVAIFAGFSVEIGAFLAGVALASSPYHFQIQGKIKPLRDFFLALFFVYLGAQVRLNDLMSSWVAVLAYTVYAIGFKPLIFALILGIFGFRKKTLFQTALYMSQVSEFALIILLVGIQTMGVEPRVLSVMAMVGVSSIIISSVMVTFSRQIYRVVSPFVGFFEHKSKVYFMEQVNESALENEVIIIGANRLGGPVVQFLQDKKVPFIVLDLNPHIIKELTDKGINAIYGDVSDTDILDLLNLPNAKIIISTANDFEDNEILLLECRRRHIKALKIIRANEPEEVDLLEKLGADIAVMPEQISGDFLVERLKSTLRTS